MGARGGRRSTSYTPTWKHGKTQTIRVPIVLAEQGLEIIRALDEGRSIDTTQANYTDLEKIDYATMLRAMNDFVKSLEGHSNGNQYKKKGEVNIKSERWYFFRKFREWVQSQQQEE